ncbi:hypothetical protein BcDW1_511 [Botrytis cinerea BcDW1]|uniref:Uncharacterized protein n=1 Tax=Botryotinia fuckeliana (strain BcDW1) TaxID=1290391 RepID=M7V3J4_BOTF1|nr:hypothetical protein BcDW1_511 [Botrytis cinerea BcDW1]
MSGVQDKMGSSTLIPYPNLDTTSMFLIGNEPRRYGQLWTFWERGLLLLVIDWYRGGDSSEPYPPALWKAAEDRISVQSVFHEWAMFLNDKPNGLETSGILAGNQGYTESQIFRCWQRLKEEQFRRQAIATLLLKILPLVGTLEAEFNVKICYIKHDKLPGKQDQINSEHVNDGTWGQYKVDFSSAHLNAPYALRIWQILVEKREERERQYDLAVRQTRHVLGLGLPVIDLWDPDLQQVFGSMRRDM